MFCCGGKKDDNANRKRKDDKKHRSKSSRSSPKDSNQHHRHHHHQLKMDFRDDDEPDSKAFDHRQLTIYRDAFRRYDRNNEAEIKVRHLGPLMKSVGEDVTKHQVKEMTKQIDPLGTGMMDFAAFLELLTDMQIAKEKKRLAESFKIFDRDGDGLITKEDLALIMESLGVEVNDDDLREMMSKFDFDKDEGLNFYEYKVVMKHGV